MKDFRVQNFFANFANDQNGIFNGEHLIFQI